MTMPLPRLGDSFVDARGEDRTLRVSVHPDRGTVVFSVWAGPACRASFQLPVDEAERLFEVLAAVRPDSSSDVGRPDAA